MREFAWLKHSKEKILKCYEKVSRPERAHVRKCKTSSILLTLVSDFNTLTTGRFRHLLWWHQVEGSIPDEVPLNPLINAITILPEPDIENAYYTIRVDFSTKKEWTLWAVGETSLQAINGSHKTKIPPDYAINTWKYGVVGGHKSPIWALLDIDFNVISFLTE